jgi:hypothetical protein
MLTEAGFTHVITRLERHAVDLDKLKRDNHYLETQRDRAETEGRKLLKRANNLDDDLIAARREQTRLRNELGELFPILVDKEHNVWLASKPTEAVDGIASVKDDAGEYASAGAQPTWQALVEAPLNPRCYLTCTLGRLALVRLPAEPTGRLVIADDIPF